VIQERYVENSVDSIRQAADEFGEGLFALSSFGADSALTLDLLQRSGADVPVLAIDTGFWFPETHAFREYLEERYGFSAVTYGPTHDTVLEVSAVELWTSNKDEYHRLTKLEPLGRAIGELGITALISGVRGHQTANRSALKLRGIGDDGEVRIHPVVGWTTQDVANYFTRMRLPRHPLTEKGYGSIGDRTTTRPGSGREGRDLGDSSECGLHIASDGTLIRAAGALASRVA